MRSTSLASRLGRALLGAALLALPLPHMACGRSACFRWTEAEGACPAQSDSMKFFSDPGCTAAIDTIDSEGVFGDGLCCYAVTQHDLGIGEEPTCNGVGGTGGVGGAPSMTSGKSGSVVSVSVGTGVPAMCLRCAQVITTPSSGAGNLCPESAFLVKELLACMCSDGLCVTVCQSNACIDDSFTEECASCVQNTEMGCGKPFNQCANDI